MSGTFSSVYNNFSSALRLHADAMAGLQEQASTGSRINRASDDPASAYQVLGLNSQKRALENYMTNISESMDILEMSSSVSDSISSLITQVTTRITQITSGTYGADEGGQEARERVAEEIDNILEEMVAWANTKHLGQYIFGGSNTSLPPYAVQRSDGQITSVTYQGGLQGRDIETAPGLQSNILYVGDSIFRSDNRGELVFLGSTGAAAGTGTSSVRGDVWLTVTDDGSGSYDLSIDDGATTVNVAAAADITNIAVTNSAGQVLYVDATNITGIGVEMVRVTGTYDIFNVLINIRDLLNNKRDLPAATAVDLIDKSAESLDEVKNVLVDKQVIIGTKINFLNALKDSLENVKFNTEDQATLLQEADIAQVAIDISRRETLYQMSLSVAARLMSMSILDFIT
jgi:flagellar hook-associated protein 3 FlgL